MAANRRVTSDSEGIGGRAGFWGFEAGEPPALQSRPELAGCKAGGGAGPTIAGSLPVVSEPAGCQDLRQRMTPRPGLESLAVLELSPQASQINFERIDALSSQGQEEISSIETCDCSCTFLGHGAPAIPVDRCR